MATIYSCSTAIRMSRSTDFYLLHVNSFAFFVRLILCFLFVFTESRTTMILIIRVNYRLDHSSDFVLWFPGIRRSRSTQRIRRVFTSRRQASYQWTATRFVSWSFDFIIHQSVSCLTFSDRDKYSRVLLRELAFEVRAFLNDSISCSFYCLIFEGIVLVTQSLPSNFLKTCKYQCSVVRLSDLFLRSFRIGFHVYSLSLFKV